LLDFLLLAVTRLFFDLHDLTAVIVAPELVFFTTN
jgi:hypothetical protein